ncbi:MAG: glycosyltransferase, partial [Ferruginibacter sp.]
RINQQISNGNDHFTTVATAGNKDGIITLLKAFSIFKKWQKSSLELIIINRAGNNNIVPQIESYKYKTSVHIISCKQDEEHELIASSYAFIDISDLSTGKEYVLKTMSCGIPVISTFPLKNVFGEAVMYSENTEKSISEKMMLIYKDEELRYKIIEKGNYFVASNSHEKMLEAIKNITEKALEQTS